MQVSGTKMLYLIEILHQTTTLKVLQVLRALLYLIEILHQTTTWFLSELGDECCILLKFYIKPQHMEEEMVKRFGCILLKFYIKPQLYCGSRKIECSCILLKFYIKPQHMHKDPEYIKVVSY